MQIRAQIVVCTRDWVGTPYQHQASLKGIGCDCFGLVGGVWRDVPERAPAYSPDWAEALRQETLAQVATRHLVPIARDEFLPGDDVLLFRWRAHLPAKHAAI